MARDIKTSVKKSKAQTIVEYCILFAAVVGVIVGAVTFAIRPALNGLYQRTAVSIGNITINP